MDADTGFYLFITLWAAVTLLSFGARLLSWCVIRVAVREGRKGKLKFKIRQNGGKNS